MLAELHQDMEAYESAIKVPVILPPPCTCPIPALMSHFFLHQSYELFLDLLASSSPDNEKRCRACLGLAKAYEKLGDLDVSRQYLESLVELSTHMGQKKVTTEACSRLGCVATQAGSHVEANTWHQRALDLASELADAHLYAMTQSRAAVSRADALKESFQK